MADNQTATAVFTPTLITVKVGVNTLRVPEPNARDGRRLEELVRKSLVAVERVRKRRMLAEAVAEGAVLTETAEAEIDHAGDEIALIDDEERELQDLALGTALNGCLEQLPHSTFRTLASAAAWTWVLSPESGQAVWELNMGKAPAPKRSRKKATAT